MDAAANTDEVRLRAGESHKERLVVGGAALFCIIIALSDFFTSAKTDRWPGVGAIAALLIGCLMLAGAILRRNVIWAITKGQILIGEQRPFGRFRSRLIRSDEISEMKLRKDRTEFSLVFNVGSGEALTSPVLPDITQVHHTALLIARLLGLPDPAPVDNALDTINPEIRLGKPVEPRTRAGNRILIVLLAGLLSFPFVHALWNNELSALGVTVWTLGLIVAAVLFRYAHRMSGTYWIIGDREIRLERLSLNGESETEAIGGRDVEAIEIESDVESDRHVILIRLGDGRKIRSPELAGKNQAQALHGEIVRRLNISGSPAR